MHSVIRNLRLTILSDNKSHNTELLSEHGLSIWIEADDHRILFDTGQSDLLVHNAQILGIDLSTADMLILSHGHFDHTGGISQILKLNPEIKIFCHPDIFTPRYSKYADGSMRFIGINQTASNSLTISDEKITWLTGPLQINSAMGISGPIPRETDFEDTGGDFYHDQQATNPDLVTDDLAIYLQTNHGTVIITGCCHSGIVNTVNYLSKITGPGRIRAIIGGFHMKDASDYRMEQTIKYIKRQSLHFLMPLHCTGANAIDLFKAQLGPVVIDGNVGSQIQFDNKIL